MQNLKILATLSLFFTNIQISGSSVAMDLNFNEGHKYSREMRYSLTENPSIKKQIPLFVKRISSEALKKVEDARSKRYTITQNPAD